MTDKCANVSNLMKANYGDCAMQIQQQKAKEAQAQFATNMQSMSGMSMPELNKTYAHLNNLLTCDTECQRRKNIDSLRNKWKAAEKAEKNAPDVTAAAEKNYWVFSKGELAYQNMLLDRYRGIAQKKLASSEKTHDEWKKEMNILIDDYTAETKAIARLKELLKVRLDENEALKEAIDEDVRQVNTNDRRVVYSDWAKDFLYDVGKGLRYLYFIIALVYLYYGPFYQDSLYKSFKGWSYPLVLLLFPFTVYYITRFIVYLYGEAAWFYENKAPRNVFINI